MCVLGQRLELHVKSLSEARNEDKKHIQKLEGELLNCSQEIGVFTCVLFCLGCKLVFGLYFFS